MNFPANNRPNDKGKRRHYNVKFLEDWTDESLLERFIHERDVKSFQVLYNRYWKKVRDAASSVINDTCTAEDVAQEVLLRVWEKPARFGNLRNPIGFLKKMSHDLAVDLARRENRMVPNGLKMDSESERCNFEAFLDFDKEQFWRVLGDILSPAQFKMIKARYKRDLTISECAQAEGVTTGTVKRHLYYAHERIKKETFFSTFFPSQSAIY